MKYEEIRVAVLEAIKDAQAQGLINGTSGNIAMRDEKDDVVAITPSGISYKGMTPDMISIVDLTGKWIDGPYKPSSETPMHTAVYRIRPDVRATVHTHSMFATIMAMGDATKLLPLTPPHCEFDPVNIVPFSMMGSPESEKYITGALGADGRACLIKNHGMFSVGATMAEAMDATAYVEELAQMTYYAKLLGTYEPMPEQFVGELKERLSHHLAV